MLSEEYLTILRPKHGPYHYNVSWRPVPGDVVCDHTAVSETFGLVVSDVPDNPNCVLVYWSTGLSLVQKQRSKIVQDMKQDIQRSVDDDIMNDLLAAAVCADHE